MKSDVPDLRPAGKRCTSLSVGGTGLAHGENRGHAFKVTLFNGPVLKSFTVTEHE